MQARVLTAAAALATAAALASTAQAAPSQATASERGVPSVRQMVVFRSGAVVSGRVLARRTTVAVGGRRCGVAAATPLAALLRAKPGRIAFHDYGACSRRPADSSGLFVRAMRGERNRAQDGWVYKVGRKLATAGAADTAGPFGRGRLRRGDRVTWFYCRQHDSGSCQRSLELETRVAGDALSVTVTGYDDAGDGVAIAGATVRAAGRRVTTDADGRATLTLPPGSHRVQAGKRGTIRAFAERVRIG
jgi:hypothetical protein